MVGRVEQVIHLFGFRFAQEILVNLLQSRRPKFHTVGSELAHFLHVRQCLAVVTLDVFQLLIIECNRSIAFHLRKIASGNMNADMMKERIFKALDVEKFRKEEADKRRIENEEFKQSYKKNKNNN